MSTGGVFFETEQAHLPGETIRLSVIIDDYTVQCEGRVVRVEPMEGAQPRRPTDVGQSAEPLFNVAVELELYHFA